MINHQKYIAVFCLVSSLSACVFHSRQPVWRNDSLTLSEANSVRNQCYTESIRKAGNDADAANENFDQCMKNNGFRKNPQWGDAPMNPVLDVFGL